MKAHFTIVQLLWIILYYSHISTVYYDTKDTKIQKIQTYYQQFKHRTQDMGNLKREYGMLDKDRSGPFKSSQGELVINQAFL